MQAAVRRAMCCERQGNEADLHGWEASPGTSGFLLLSTL